MWTASFQLCPVQGEWSLGTTHSSNHRAIIPAHIQQRHGLLPMVMQAGKTVLQNQHPPEKYTYIQTWHCTGT